MKNSLLFRMVVLVAAVMCALGVSAQEAYACYTSDNTTLSFYYDNDRSTRTGTTYDLNDGAVDPGWVADFTNTNVKQVVFDPSFEAARQTSTFHWFYEMRNLESITGLEYLNTSEVVRMDGMFNRCYKLTSLDLDKFNLSKVTDLSEMFRSCSALQTIYVSDGWRMSEMAQSISRNVFKDCSSLVGGQGTAYDADHVDADYAHIDGGTGNPGYFTDKYNPVAYAVFENSTLTFYYDFERNSRTGKIYELNTGYNWPAWFEDGITGIVSYVVFDPSFADARPTSTQGWFLSMQFLESITGLEYLNTSEVTNMGDMFHSCANLTSIDVSHFNTDKVTYMAGMFANCERIKSLDLSSFNTSNVIVMRFMFLTCSELQTIYVGDGWSTDALGGDDYQMFLDCNSLVGGKGTAYNPDHITSEYAHIDGGPSDPGYFTDKNAGKRGDVNGNSDVDMDDLTALINYLLTGNTADINMANAANCDSPSSTVVDMDDLTALINYLLSGTWPEVEPQPVTETFTVNGVTFTMVMVEGGTFTMGATPEQGDEAIEDEKPAHQVTLSSYWIGQTEVTQALWQAVMGENPSDFPGDLERPVEMVSWPECQAFINTLNQITGKNFKFPTEAQWEFAARGGNLSKGYKYAGSNNLDDVAWYYYDGCTELTTHAVATKQPNELGIYDMSGNVKEWCHEDYAPYSSEPQTDPVGPSGVTNRVYRGGGWASTANECRVTYRYSNRYWANSIGLRLAL